MANMNRSDELNAQNYNEDEFEMSTIGNNGNVQENEVLDVREENSTLKQPGIPNVSKENMDVTKSPFISFNYYSETSLKSKVQCNTCGKIVGRVDGNTNGMTKHLQGVHTDLFKLFLEDKAWVLKRRQEIKLLRSEVKTGDGKKQLLLTKDNNKLMIQKLQIDPILQKRFDEALVLYGAQNYLSFRALANLGPVISAASKGQPKVKVKAHVTIGSYTTTMAKQLREDIQGIINLLKKSVNSWGFSTDIWTGPNLDSFLSMTLHAITEDFVLLKLVPFVRVFYGSHTGQAIQIMLDDYIVELGLDSNLIRKTGVFDNASNNKAAIKRTELFDAWFCIIHTLQLTVTDIFFKETIKNVSIRKVLGKCATLAKKLRNSTRFNRELKAACKVVGVNFVLPPIPNKTRWNSTFSNLEGVLRIRLGLQHIQANMESEEWIEIIPSFNEWKTVTSLIQILEKMKVATKKFEADKVPTMHLVVKELFNLVSDLEDLSLSGENAYTKEIAGRLLEKVQMRYPNYGTDHMLPKLAHYLDPEVKGLILHEVNEFNSTKEEIKRLSRKYHKTPIVEIQTDDTEDTSDGTESDSNLTATQRLKRRKMDESVTPTNLPTLTPIEVEMAAYESLVDDWTDKSDILSWFRERGEQFPLLARLAREVNIVKLS